ncbi:type II toxin-antitoxin system VapC family toxin [Mycobacterium talmoniae]|uniref:PIN domain-containing protein n=1 Tax=Mycobacterium talmoniae TaxID=1858794 RepID=A0A1S1MI04_9MYCO|nr:MULTISPECIES: type II toxin-antitoxin system VapC family toxin [Mycobacterium]OHU82912.1 PIN domain-containing protein [Mycobacterium talmoniae]PQM44525.1 Ribonuclease VapC47 [Mycobacterium talmoniae]TDH48068.1 PIN domain-containing protein [Mycobacterium eburneum]
MLYLDASAIVTYVLKRPNVADLTGYLRDHPDTALGTSTLGLVETVRTCDRFGDFPNLMVQLLRDYTELRLTAEIRDQAANLPGGLKTLDAIHVATAETLGKHMVAFITYDRRMADVAESLGFPVASPGMRR